MTRMVKIGILIKNAGGNGDEKIMENLMFDRDDEFVPSAAFFCRAMETRYCGMVVSEREWVFFEKRLVLDQ